MSQLTFLQLSPASVAPTAQDLAEARKKKQGRIYWFGWCLAMVTYGFTGFDYGVLWLLGFTLANAAGYWLSPRTPENFPTWLNRQMMPYALGYAFFYQPFVLLREWLPGWPVLLYLACTIGLSIVLNRRYGHLLEEPAPHPGPMPVPSLRP